MLPGANNYFISTLLYCFNDRDEVLLIERAREPNLGLWSPCGGKLETRLGESPYACACREAAEELGLRLAPTDLRLRGIVSEAGETHWLMFLFEVMPRVNVLPPAHPEGHFGFFAQTALSQLPLPRTDREKIWPLFWENRHGFFAAHHQQGDQGCGDWTVEESGARTATE